MFFNALICAALTCGVGESGLETTDQPAACGTSGFALACSLDGGKSWAAASFRDASSVNGCWAPCDAGQNCQLEVIYCWYVPCPEAYAPPDPAGCYFGNPTAWYNPCPISASVAALASRIADAWHPSADIQIRWFEDMVRKPD